jgi:hypothetical protein
MLMRNPTRCDIYTRDRQRICIYVGFTCLCFRCEEFKIIYKITVGLPMVVYRLNLELGISLPSPRLLPLEVSWSLRFVLYNRPK